MHDVMRDLALWIALDCGANQNKWLVKSAIRLREVQLEVKKWKEAQVVSLMHNLIKEFPPVPFECPNLSFLMLQGNWHLRKIHPSIFQNTRALTILSLQSTDVHKFPESISMLTMLRYLNLSHTRVRSLPKGLGNLTRLRYLDLNGCTYLESIPAGVIASLVKLQVLDLSGIAVDEILICCTEVDKNDGEQFVEISSKKGSLIDEVECLLGGLKGFGVDLCSADAFQHLSILLTCVHLAPWIIRRTRSYHLKHNMWSNLESLQFADFNNAVALEFDTDAQGEINDTCPINTLRIYGLRELKEIIFRGVVPSVFFQRLKSVEIRKCGRLKNINWILGVQSLTFFSLISCVGIECLVNDFPRKGG